MRKLNEQRGLQRHVLETWTNNGFYLVPDRETWSQGLNRIRLFALTFFAFELVGFGWWSTVVVRKFALSWDFAINLQALYQISHFQWAAHLTTFRHGVSFYQIHGVFMEFFLGMIYHLWQSPLVLLWAQDIFIVGAQLLIFLMMLDYQARQEKKHENSRPVALLAIGIALLVLNPWILYAISFDYHSQPIAAFMVLLAVRSLLMNQKRSVVFVLFALFSGDIATTYLFGAGISLAMVGKKYWKVSFAIIVTAVFYSLLLAHFHFNKGSPTAAFNYLIGAHGVPANVQTSPIQLVISLIERPWRAVAVLWNRHVDIVANLSAPGLIGYFTPWTIAVPTITLILNALPFEQKNEFIVPFFQSLPVYMVVPLGTTIWLSFLTNARNYWMRILGWGLAALVVINVVGWAIVWDSTTKSHWLPVHDVAANELRIIAKKIPLEDEVIASQGIMGLLGARPSIYPLNNGRIFPITSTSHVVWVVIAPAEGIEIQSSLRAQELITYLAQEPSATMEYHKSGVYAFRVKPPLADSILVLKRGSDLAWVNPGSAGTPITKGPESKWHLSSKGETGYAMSYDYFRLLPGKYKALIDLETRGPLIVEVWDNSINTMLVRQNLTSTGGRSTITMPFSLINVVGDKPFAGYGWWVIKPTPGPPGDQIEIRAFTPLGLDLKIYTATVRKVKY